MTAGGKYVSDVRIDRVADVEATGAGIVTVRVGEQT